MKREDLACLGSDWLLRPNFYRSRLSPDVGLGARYITATPQLLQEYLPK